MTATDAPRDAAGCGSLTPVLGGHTRSLTIVLIVTAAFMLVEVAGGLLADSLALLADAGHMLTDVAAIGLALFVSWIARRPATPGKTYGYLRLEILAALVNGAALLVIAGSIVWEAIERLGSPRNVEPRILFGVATVGLVVNLLAMRLLRHGHSHSLNIRGAYLHVLGDLLGSVGAIVAGAVILLTGWTPVDPLVSVAIAGLIVISGWRLVRESVDVLLEGTPGHISLAEVEAKIAEIPGVVEVHDLHVWTVTSGVVAMSGHAVVPDAESSQHVLETAQGRLAGLGIHHVTLQVEQEPRCAPVLHEARV